MDRMQYARIKHHNYAAFLYSKEKWITLENGTHVQIDGEGNITGGPSALKEKGITNLGHFGNKSSTSVDKTKSSADTADVSNPSTEQQGMSLTNPDGSHLVVTKVDRPYQDDHGFWIHGISTRPATEEEIPQIQERRAKQAQEKAEHSAHLQRMHGGEMR